MEGGSVGISLKLVSFDDLFHSTRHEVTIVNDESIALAEEKEELNRKIYTRYEGDDLLSNLPSCECTKTVGEYNLGFTCPECGTMVEEPSAQSLEPIVWMRAPAGVRSLINPIFWTHVSEFFSKGQFDVLRWIADKGYHPIVRTPAVLDAVKEAVPDRGYNYFLDNFRPIINALLELKDYRTPAKRREAADLLEYMRVYEDCLFPQYIPLPNKSLIVIEKSNVGTYIDTTIIGAVDAIRTMTSIDLPETNFSVRVKENRTIKTICQLSEFYLDWNAKSLAGKRAIPRKHLFGSRSDFSFRAVITSISCAHRYDEVFISWGIAVAVFKIHLTNKLISKHGMFPNEIMGFLDEHAEKYHPLLAELFDELIRESPYNGIPIILGRNPALRKGSTQLVFITRVEKDTRIRTIAVSLMICKALNADFDGKRLLSLNFSNCWKLL
jgi:hypothetical protein